MSLLLSLFIGIGISKLLALPTFLGVGLGLYLHAQKIPRTTFNWYQYNHQDQYQAAFNHHCFGLMGYLAKADGVVSRVEILEAEAIMREMALNHTQKSLAKSSFQSGSKGLNLAHTIAYLKTLQHTNPASVRAFFRYQERIIHIDPSNKMQQLSILNQIKFRMFNQQQYSHQPRRQSPLPQAYRILGVTPNTPYPEMKKAYKRLVGKHHPDRAHTDAEKQKAEALVKQIHSAWKTIKDRHKEPV